MLPIPALAFPKAWGKLQFMQRKIAIFDSGVGGLTVFRQIRARYPNDSIVYVGDTARVPYGSRSPKIICQYSEEIVRHLLTMPLSALVVGCHSSASVAVPTLQPLLHQQTPPIPLLDVLSSGVKRAAELDPEGPIAIIGTEATIQSGRYRDELSKIRPKLEIFPIACPLFVPLVEEGILNGAIAELVIDKYLEPIVGRVHAVMLACTHYPLLAEVIQDYLGPDVELIDPAEAVALDLELQLSPSSSGARESLFQVTDHPQRFDRIARQFLGEEIPFAELISVSQPVIYSQDDTSSTGSTGKRVGPISRA